MITNFVNDWYLVDECNDCRKLVAEGTNKSRLLVARDLAKGNPNNERLQHLWYETAGAPHVDPRLALELERRVAC